MSQFKQVTVKSHPVTGLVITPTKKPGFGSFRVESEEITVRGNFMNKTTKVAFVRGPIELLEEMGLSEGKKLTGQIIVKESHTPFYEGQTPKINPSTGEIIMLNGMEVYRETEFTHDLTAHDTFPHSPTPVAVETQSDQAM